MKAVMKSVSPRICEKVANGDCTILVSKTAPKCEESFKCYIYCTSSDVHSALVVGDGDAKLIHCCNYKSAIPVGGEIGNSKVIGEFVCDKVIKTCGWRLRGDTQQCAKRTTDEESFPELACLTIDEIVKYAGSENREVCGWHISDLKIYDEPKQISDFLKPCPDPYHYCTICKHCIKIIPPDEEEYAFYHGGHYDYCEEHCMNILRNPPKGWQYVEEI